MRLINFGLLGTILPITVTISALQTSISHQQLLTGKTPFEQLGIAKGSNFRTALDAYTKIDARISNLPPLRQQADKELALEALINIGTADPAYQNDLFGFIHKQIVSAYRNLKKNSSDQTSADILERFLDVLQKSAKKPMLNDTLKTDLQAIIESILFMQQELLGVEKKYAMPSSITILTDSVNNTSDKKLLANFVHRYHNSPAILMIPQIQKAYNKALFELIFFEDEKTDGSTDEFKRLLLETLPEILKNLNPQPKQLQQVKDTFRKRVAEINDRFLSLMEPLATALKKGNTENQMQSLLSVLALALTLQKKYIYEKFPEMQKPLNDLAIAANRLYLITLNPKNPEARLNYLKNHPESNRLEQQFAERIATIEKQIATAMSHSPITAYRQLRGILIDNLPLFYASYALRNAYVSSILDLVKTESAALGAELPSIKERLRNVVLKGWHANDAFKINSDLYQKITELN